MAKKSVSLRIEENLWDELGEWAEAQGTTVTAVVTRLIEEVLQSKPVPIATRLEVVEQEVTKIEELAAKLHELEGKLIGSQYSHSEPANRYAAKSLSDLLPQQAG